MIDLYIADRGHGLPSIDPLSMAAEGFLNISETPFRVITESNLFKAATDNLPMIRDNGIIVRDLELIMRHIEHKLQISMDGHLNSQQRALHLCASRMLSQHLCLTMHYCRWLDPETYQPFVKTLFSDIPPPINVIVKRRQQQFYKRQMQSAGLHALDSQDIYQKAGSDLSALADILADQQWFGGDYVAKLDIIALSVLSNILYHPVTTPLIDQVQQHDNLLAFEQRAKSLIFPADYQPSTPQIFAAENGCD